MDQTRSSFNSSPQLASHIDYFFNVLHVRLGRRQHNKPYQHVQMEGLNLSYAGIQLDAVEPAVIDVYSPKETSPWGGVYTVGEEVSSCSDYLLRSCHREMV